MNDSSAAHLRDDAPYRVCDRCGRKSWASEQAGPCGMPQPDGSRCAGTFRHQAAAQGRREWSDDWITCPRCESQKYDRGSCGLCGNLGVLDVNGEPFHCDCSADDWVEGDNQAIRCETCGGYAGEPGTSIRVVAVDA